MKQPMQVMFLMATMAMIVTAICLGATYAKEEAEPPSTKPQVAAADSLGNHWAVLKVAEKADAVWVRIPWHRRDPEPERKNILVIEESTGKKVANRLPIDVKGDYGEILFQANHPGIYHVYYMPYISQESSYPKATYPALENTADPAWLANYGLKLNAPNAILPENFPHATFVGIQSIDEFSSYTPMEVAASPEEENKLAAAHPDKPFLLFPEDRANPIRMTDHLPQKWIAEGPKQELAGEAARGEFYVFQLGLYAVTADIPDITVSFSDLQTSDGSRVIPSTALRCINTGGTNWDGVAFQKPVRVPKGRVQALWCGVQVPKDLGQGNYQGQVRIKPAGMPEQSVGLALTVTGKRLDNSGDNEPWKHSRLRWLDSTLALDDEIVQPFLPIQVKQDTLEILGRRLELAPSGLPSQVLSCFSPEVTKIQETAKPLLAAPLELIVEDSAGQNMKWSPGEIHFTKKQDGIVQWNTTRTAGPLRMDLVGTLEFDGFTQFKVTISSTEPVAVRDIRLEMPLIKQAVKYLMGLGLKGGVRPASCEWVWGVKKNQDGAWLGDANAGLQFKLKGENFSRPLLTNFYADKPLNMPHSWSNDGKGGISIRESQDSSVVVRCYGGARTLKPGENLHFDFDLLLTPFKPLDTKGQWSTRYFHSYQPVDEVLQTGANTVNIHHGNEANPYINYPFIHVAEMKHYIDEAHDKGLKVKIYYTIRELSNHANELFALRSLGDEIFPQGPGGGHPWLQEHLGSNYLPAWCVPQWQDAAIINNGMSRWNNYYIEGLDWLVKNVGIDGLYLDDLGFDRTTMKRIRKVLDRGRPGSLIDFHSANLYNPKDGFGNCASIYLEHLPYINRLWFGEYFDHDAPPDFWLTELSGIPYGVMGEMLQDGGNKWRGMIYGMTNRIPYQGNDPSPIWKVWDEFKIQESAMIGYWSSNCPVKTNHEDVLATAYAGHEKCLVALASWAAEDVNVRLSIDWHALGIDPAKAKIIAPEIRDYQAAARFNPGDSIPVPQGKGWLLVVTPG